ncbi:MAG: four helix bundle protein [Planctomycetota bacterium]
MPEEFSMQDYQRLRVWQSSHKLTLLIYHLTRSFPDSERYGLSSQIRRSAISVESNIAEGCGRRSNADFARFLNIAFGSANECECQALIARDLGLIDHARYDLVNGLTTDVKRMLSGLLKRVAAA